MRFLDWLEAQPGMTEVILVQGDDGSGYYLLEATNTIFGKIEITVTEGPL